MLDENLPTFLLAESTDNIQHHSTFYQTRGGSEPVPVYSLHHADPVASNSKNCYAAALFDSYTSGVLYGEVLLRPDWTRPTLSQEEIRRNGGVPPAPEPILPLDFTVQLYNPDVQIPVKRETGMLGSSYYDFSVPQGTFRMPSSSMLDRSQDDPAATSTVPKINFRWKKESKLSKDYVLYLRGKSTDAIQKKKSKEPDIVVALFKSQKELTLYDSNIQRIEMEDPKGLEVAILLTAAVIKEVYNGQIYHAFNISDPPPVKLRRTSGNLVTESKKPALSAVPIAPVMASGALDSSYVAPHPNAQQQPTIPPLLPDRQEAQPPPTDPRTQWEIDTETARLKAAQDAERREQQRVNDARRRERERKDEEEQKKLRKMLEAEDRERQRKQKEIDKETERLRKLYGKQGGPTPNQQQVQPNNRVQSAPIKQGPFPQAPSRPLPQQQINVAQTPQQQQQYYPQQHQYPSHPTQASYNQYQPAPGQYPLSAPPTQPPQRPQSTQGYHPPGRQNIPGAASLSNLTNAFSKPQGASGSSRLGHLDTEIGRLSKKMSSIW